MSDEKRKIVERDLTFKISRFLEREKGNFFLKNPYQVDDIFDLVEYVGKFSVPELYPFSTMFVKTKDEQRKQFGVQAEYFWYDDRWTYAIIAALILHHILQTNGNNIRIKTKLRSYYKEALEDLKLSEIETTELLEDILKKKLEIVRMSS